MASVKESVMHDNVLGGLDTTSPPWLLTQGQWVTQHNMRLIPALQQVPRKFITQTLSPANEFNDPTLVFLGVIPIAAQGYGTLIGLGSDTCWNLTPAGNLNTYSATSMATLISDMSYRRWATKMYNGNLYYTNELNPLRVNNGAIDQAVPGGIAGRYLAFYYDHAVIAYPTGFPDRVQISDLYNFGTWNPLRTNEADFYDVVEWQESDRPYKGITGMGRLRGRLWLYTASAIIPLRYVGLPKVLEISDNEVITRNGNTYPWTVVCLDTRHFFFDANEMNFFTFDGQTVEPIGEPVRNFIKANLNTNSVEASFMFGYIDDDNREIWWPFVSATNDTGWYDKAVVFNYRYRKWFTASVEDVACFCKQANGYTAIGNTGSITIGNLSPVTGQEIGELGLAAENPPVRVFGATNTATGRTVVLNEETPTTDASVLLAQDTPTLESPDFHYGDIRTIKECDAMVINAYVPHGADAANPTTTTGTVALAISTRTFLGAAPFYPSNPNGVWNPTPKDNTSSPERDGLLTFQAVNGRVFRFMFSLLNTRMAMFSAFAPTMYLKKAEK